MVNLLHVPSFVSSDLHFLRFGNVEVYRRYLLASKASASWRNGSAFDSRSKGYPFKSGRGQFLYLVIRNHPII
ncbi:hypothetical protein F5B19DRAFT_461528 [Rostrohypoxylon terebratum]|nr:hypothetical protein F5B19DRAFT_461528 [Rostrohypoxylon terebratum]